MVVVVSSFIGGQRARAGGPVRQLMDAGMSLGSRPRICDLRELNTYRSAGLGSGFLSANAGLAIRPLARRNSVAKQDPTLLRQFCIPS
jgi:hypothetical protein